MLSKKLHDALNEQINAELWSAYLYLSMSMDAEAKGLKGVANWFFVQFQEEQDHARILMNYINSRDAKVELKPIAEVRTEWASPLDMFKDTLEHEKVVTSMINNLASIAAEDKDFASANMLVWFVDEQVEEEESARDMITACEAVEGNKFGLYTLDKELAARVYQPASPQAAPMRTGSPAVAMAVFTRQAAAPISIASQACEGLPMPASTTMGRLISSMRIRPISLVWRPRLVPMGAPRGMTAAAPAFTRSRATYRSGFMYGRTVKPSLARGSVALAVS